MRSLGVILPRRKCALADSSIRLQDFLYGNILFVCEAIRNIFSIVFQPVVHLEFHFALIPLTCYLDVPEELPDQRYTAYFL
jgi:hypothetical protein